MKKMTRKVMLQVTMKNVMKRKTKITMRMKRKVMIKKLIFDRNDAKDVQEGNDEGDDRSELGGNIKDEEDDVNDRDNNEIEAYGEDNDEKLKIRRT